MKKTKEDRQKHKERAHLYEQHRKTVKEADEQHQKDMLKCFNYHREFMMVKAYLRSFDTKTLWVLYESTIGVVDKIYCYNDHMPNGKYELVNELTAILYRHMKKATITQNGNKLMFPDLALDKIPVNSKFYARW